MNRPDRVVKKITFDGSREITYESAFATVRHRTVRMKGALSQDTARLMVFKLVMAASKSSRRLQGQNVWPAPSARVLAFLPFSVCCNVSGFRTSPEPRWRSARSGPHNQSDQLGHFVPSGFQIAVRLLGHLAFTSRKHHLSVAELFDGPILQFVYFMPRRPRASSRTVRAASGPPRQFSPACSPKL